MTKRPSDGCKEAGDALTLGASDEIKTARARLHLKHCETCRQDEQIVSDLRDAVLAVDDRLDDLSRARVQTRLAQAMEQASREGEARAASRSGRGLKLAVSAAAAAVFVVAAASMIWRGQAAQAPGPVKDVIVKAPARQDTTSVLQPNAVLEGSVPWPGSEEVRLGKKVSRLQLPAGVELRASLAQGAELALYGPVDLAVKEADASHTELKLSVGAMVVDYDAGKGRLLRIVSPGAITEVVGTLFSVEVRAGQTLVSVSRGKVKVRSGGATVEVLPGQTWSSEKKSLGQTPADSAALLARHAGETVASSAPVGEVLAASRARSREGAGERFIPEPPREARTANSPSPTKQDKHIVPETPSREATRTSPTETAKQQPPPSASALYAQAETALGSGDQVTARRIFERLLKAHAKDPLADSARYELALLMVRAGQMAQAERILGQVGPAGGSSLQEPAHFLRCRIKQDNGEREAARQCYLAFRKRFPISPHDDRARRALNKLVEQK